MESNIDIFLYITQLINPEYASCFFHMIFNTCHSLENIILNYRNILPIKVCSYDIGEKNMACCELVEDIMNNSYKILNWEIIDLTPKTNGKIEHICYNIPKMILDREYMFNARHLALESQPRFNTRMRIISYALATSFICLSKNKETLNIKFISPTQKLKRLDFDLKLSYKDRKREAIILCMKILNSMEDSKKYVDLLSEKKKLDDFADCFLQAIVYIEEQRATKNKSKVEKKSSIVEKKKKRKMRPRVKNAKKRKLNP